MSKFVGNWILEKSEGFEDYLRATGVPAEHVKMAASVKPVLNVKKEGATWKININTPVKNDSYTFTENVPFLETNPFNQQPVRTVVKPQGPTKYVQEFRDQVTNNLVSTSVREIVADKLVQTIVAGQVRCKQTFKRLP